MIIGGDKKTHVLDEIDSTNNYAKKLAGEGAENGTVVWTKRQTAGKGSHNRKWEGIDGNVFYSVIIRLEAMDIPYSRRLTYINALAVYNTIYKYIDERSTLSIKWPNDILLNGKKVAGTLLEGGGKWIVIGTGINVVACPNISMIYPPTSLKDEGYEAKREDIISELNTQLGNEIQCFLDGGFSSVRDRYLHKAFKLNDEISVGNRPDKTDYVRGIYLGIDDDGFLLLKQDDEIKKIFSGTVNV